jgi:hypothetical protein
MHAETLDGLIQRVTTIKAATSDAQGLLSRESAAELARLPLLSEAFRVRAAEAEAADPLDSMDEFDQRKTKIDLLLRGIRLTVNRRDGMDLVTAARQSSELRKAIRLARRWTQDLQDWHAAKLDKLERKGGAGLEQARTRATIVQLIWAHIQEADNLVRRVPDDEDAPAPAPAFDATITHLPAISSAEGAVMQLNEQVLEALLERLGAGLAVTREMALAMQRELDRQGVALDDLNERTDADNQHIEAHRSTLDEQLKRQPASRVCLLLTGGLLLLGLIGTLVSFFA